MVRESTLRRASTGLEFAIIGSLTALYLVSFEPSSPVYGPLEVPVRFEVEPAP